MNFRRLTLLVSFFLLPFCLILHSDTVKATGEENGRIIKRLRLSAPPTDWRATLYLLNADADEPRGVNNLEDLFDKSREGFTLQVFAYLDLQSGLNLSQASKKIYANTRDARFLADCGAIHLDIGGNIQAQAWDRINRQPNIAPHMLSPLLDAVRSSFQQVSNLVDSGQLGDRFHFLGKSMAILIALSPTFESEDTNGAVKPYHLSPARKTEILDALWGAYRSFSGDVAITKHPKFTEIGTTSAEILVQFDPEIIDTIAEKIPETIESEQENDLKITSGDLLVVEQMFTALIKKNPVNVRLKLLTTLHNSNYLYLRVFSAWALGSRPQDQSTIDSLKQISENEEEHRLLQMEAKTSLGSFDPTYWYDLMTESGIADFHRYRPFNCLKQANALPDSIIDRMFEDVLTHGNMKAREYIAELLISTDCLGDMRLIPTLLRIFQTDPSDIMKTIAARGLATHEPEALFSFLSYKNVQPKSRGPMAFRQPVHRDGNLRLMALIGMRNLKTLSEKNIAVICNAMLADPNRQIRFEVANFLAVSDIKSEGAYNDLLAAARGDCCPDVKAKALKALVKNFGAGRVEVRAISLRILENEKDPHLLISTMNHLIDFPNLPRQECINMRSSVATHLLTHPHFKVRIAAAKTICRLKWRDADTASALVKAFKKNEKPSVHGEINKTLDDLGLFHLVSDANQE